MLSWSWPWFRTGARVHPRRAAAARAVSPPLFRAAAASAATPQLFMQECKTAHKQHRFPSFCATAQYTSLQPDRQAASSPMHAVAVVLLCSVHVHPGVGSCQPLGGQSLCQRVIITFNPRPSSPAWACLAPWPAVTVPPLCPPARPLPRTRTGAGAPSADQLPSKGLFGLPFMKRALDRRRAAAQQEATQVGG